MRGRMSRIKALLGGQKAYMNPASDLLDGYSDLLSTDDKSFLISLRDYKNNKTNKINILKDKSFVRPSRLSTILLKLSVLSGKY